MARRIQAAQRLVEGRQFALFGVVGEQRDDIGLLAQHIVHKALEGLLGTDLDKGAAAVGVERFQPLDPLDGRGNLEFQNVFDALDCGRVEFAGNVGDQRKPRLADSQPIQHLAQRLAGRCDNTGVEGMADGDAHRLEALLIEDGNGLLDGLAFTANHTLVVGVDVGGHRIAIDLIQRLHDDVVGRHDRGHPAVVFPADLGHLGAAGC